MEAPLSPTNVIFNVLVQVINLVIFFLLFKYFLGDKVSKWLKDRKILIEKLKMLIKNIKISLSQQKLSLKKFF